MFRETVPCHITVMVMVTNHSHEVLTVNRVRSWPGITFPGGHLEPGESVLDCARREVREETGILIRGLALTGLIHWSNRDKPERYLVWCVRAEQSGGVLEDSPEGAAAWLPLHELKQHPLSPGFAPQLQLFTDDAVQEAFGTYGKDGDSTLTYDKGD